MKIYKLKDCEVTDPPSSIFAVLIDQSPINDAEAAFMAELIDLRGAGRVEDHFVSNNITDKQVIHRAINEARTPRVQVTSLAVHLDESPNSNDEYREQILEALEHAWLDPRGLILAKTFFIRFFWF